MPLILSLVLVGLFAVFPDRCEAEVEAWLAEKVVDTTTEKAQLKDFIKARIPRLDLPRTVGSLEEWSEPLRKRVLDEVVFRGCPAEWADWRASTVWGDVVDMEEKGYRIRKLRYEALPGMWISALLYEPVGLRPDREKVPAILNVNGHVGPPGKGIEYEQVRCINLAKRGMLALHPEWLSFGELQGDGFDHNKLAYLDLCGRSGLSVFYLAMRGGVDVLLDRPGTDRERVAMTGLSGGGWQTIVLGSLDTRLTLLAPNAGYTGLADRLDRSSDIGDLEQNPTDLVAVADYTHLTALLAPRPALLIYNEEDDCCFKTRFARASVYDPIRPLYASLGLAPIFEFHSNLEPGTHNYDLDNRQRFYHFVDRHFFPEHAPSDRELPTKGEIFTPEELYMGLPEENADFITLAEDLLEGIPRKSAPPEFGSNAREAWKKDARIGLRRVLRVREAPSVEARSIRKDAEGAVSAEWFEIGVNDEWALSVLCLEKGEPTGTVVLIADEGIANATETVSALLAAGSRVIAFDPLFLPTSPSPWQRTQMVATVGERPLGIQAAQVWAVTAWAGERYPEGLVTVRADGPTAGVVGACAAGLAPGAFAKLELAGALRSLKDLIRDRTKYAANPTLFCFGLLERFDTPDLLVLGEPTRATWIE